MTHETKTYLDGRITLHLGDCMAILPSLPKVASVITDPPYGINYVYGGGGQGRTTDGYGNVVAVFKAFGRVAPIVGDDAPFDPAHLLALAPRVLLWGADHFRARLPPGGRMLCWDKSVGLGAADSFTDAEFAWSNVPTLKRNVYRHLWKGIARQKHRHDMCGGGCGERFHVSQKPVGLMRWCIEQLRGPVDGIVLDPYMGSGSTAIAAITLGRRFIGIEIDRDHFDTACRRIEAVLADPGAAAWPASPA